MSRVDFQYELEELLGSRNVYYQPPESLKISYPAIVYSRSNINTRFSNNQPYNLKHCYTVTLIDPDPDSLIVDKLAMLPKSNFDRHFTANNLNHDVFTIYHD